MVNISNDLGKKPFILIQQQSRQTGDNYESDDTLERLDLL